MSSQSAMYSGFYYAGSCSFYRTNYVFSHWKGSDGNTYNPGNSIRVTGDFTLTAVWTYSPPPVYYYDVTYSGNGATGGSTSGHYDVEEDTYITIRSCGFTKTGYTFVEWNTNSSGTGTGYDPGDRYRVDYDEVFYAIWKVNTYIVSFNGNGATSGSMSSQTKTYGVTLTLRANTYVRTGYNFLGWSTSSTATTATWSDRGSYTNNASNTLYAVWQRATYTNYYRYRNTSDLTASRSQIRTYGQGFTTLTTSSISEYVSNGWSLYGWATSSSSTSRTYSTGASVTSTTYTYSTSTLYWYAISSRTVRISYNTNGGSFSSTPSTTGTQYWNQYGNAISTVNLTVTSTKPTKTGYIFKGWSTNSSGSGATYDPGDIYSFSKAYNLSASVTLYAVWQANNPAHYDEEGGYWYIENGYMPQKKVTDSGTISGINSSSTTGTTYYFAGLTLQSKVYGGKEYCKYNNSWYEVMPIRWRLVYSSSQTSGYGTTTDTLAVMDEIVYVDAFSDSYIGAGAGYSSESVTELMKNQFDVTYLVSESKNMPTFGSTSLNGTPASVSSNIFVASYDDLSNFTTNKNGTEKLGKIKFSDLAKDYLRANGKDTLYFTRDLGKTYNHIYCMNANGDRVQYKANNLFGVQFSILVTEFACVE